MLQGKYSSSHRSKKTVQVRLMCQGRKDEVWSVASSVEVRGLKENYNQKNKKQLSQDMMWMFNGREIHDDESMSEIGMKYGRENVVMIMKRNTDRPSIEQDYHTVNGTPIEQVADLDDEEHEAHFDNYGDFNIDLTGDEYVNSSETDEDYNDRQERFEKMKKSKEASEKRKDRQTSSVKLAEQVENYKGNLEIGEILKNIGEHNVDTKHKPKKGQVNKKKSNSRTKLQERPPENLEQEAIIERKQNVKKVDVNVEEALIDQSTESTDDNLDLSSWEKVSKGSRKKPKNPGMEKKPEEGKHKKYIVKSFEDSWPPLESNPSYKRTILSSRNNAAKTEMCPISDKIDPFFDNIVKLSIVNQNKTCLDEADCNANIKEFKEVADCNANIKVAKEEVFSIKSEVANQLDKTNETTKEFNTAPSSISVNCQQEQSLDLGSNDDISKVNYSQVTKAPLIKMKIEQSSLPLLKVTNDLKSNNVLQELSPTSKTTEYMNLKGNVHGVKESILDCPPKIEKDYCPIKTCPLVSDVIPFGPQTKTVNHFQTIQSSSSNIKSPFGCGNGSFSKAGHTETYEYGSTTDSAKLTNSHQETLCAVVSREVTENADLTASPQISLVIIGDLVTATGLQEEITAMEPKWIPEEEESCTQFSEESNQDSDELATLHPSRINEGEKMCTPSNDANSENLLCGASYETRVQEDSEPVLAHERQSDTSQPDFPLDSCPLSQEGPAVTQQNYLLQPVLPVENLPYDGPEKSPVAALSFSSLSFGLDSAETPPDNISSDDKTYDGTLERPHNLLRPKNLSDLPVVSPPEDLLSPLHDDHPPDAREPDQQIVFLQPLMFFCAPQVPQLPQLPPCVTGSFQQANVISQKSNPFPSTTQQPAAFSGSFQQTNTFSGSSQQPNPFSITSQQPHAFSGSSHQPSVVSPQLQTSLTAQHLPQLHQLIGTGQLHQGRDEQYSEQFPGGVQQEQQLFSGLPQNQQQFLNVHYPQLSNIPIQQLLPSEQQQQLPALPQPPAQQQPPYLLQPQLPSAQQQSPYLLQPQLPSAQPQLPSAHPQLLSAQQQAPYLLLPQLPSAHPQLSSAQQQHPYLLHSQPPSAHSQLSSAQQQLPYLLQLHLPSAQQQLPSLLQTQLSSAQQQQLPSTQQQLPSAQQQHLSFMQQHMLPALEQQRPYVQQQLFQYLQQQFSSINLPQQQQLGSGNLYEQQQHTVVPQFQQFPSVHQTVVPEFQQIPSVQQQQHTVVPQLQQFPSVQQQQGTVVPLLQQFPSVQQQELFSDNLLESHHPLPAEYSAQHQHVTSQCLPVEYSQQLSFNLPNQHS